MKRFTIVFDGDIRKLGFNPLSKESEWGNVVAASVGDALSTLGLLEEKLNAEEPDVSKISEIIDGMYEE